MKLYDVSKCGTAEHTSVMAIAWVAVVIYPIGTMLFCATLIFKASPAIIAGKETSMTRATAFLHKEYEPTGTRLRRGGAAEPLAPAACR